MAIFSYPICRNLLILFCVAYLTTESHGWATMWCKNNAEKFNRLNRVHHRCRQTDDRRNCDANSRT